MSLDLNNTNVEYKDNKVIIKSIPKNGENLSVFMRPGDEVVFDIEGFDADELEYVLVGGDIVVSFANEGVLTFPSLGLMGFSNNPPQFNFGGNKSISVDNILSKIEEINELPITSVDASFKVTISNNEEDETPTDTKVDEKTAPTIVVSQTQLQADLDSRREDYTKTEQNEASFNFNSQLEETISNSTSIESIYSNPYNEYTKPNDFDAYKPDVEMVPKSDENLIPDNGFTGIGNGDGTGEGDGDGNVDDAAKPIFYFKTTAHQVTYKESVNDEGTTLIQGGGGSLEGYKFDSVTNQFETETIDMSARSQDMIIRAENSIYFDNNPTEPNYLSRVLRFEPQMPEGFYIDNFVITGFPDGVVLLDKNGVEIVGSNISKEDMVFKDSLGNTIEYGSSNFITEFKSVEFSIKYKDSISDSFNTSITANYKLEASYSDTTDLASNQVYKNDYTFALKDITSAGDYTYKKEDFIDGADEGFILSKEPNTNTIKDGSGDSIIVGGIGKDIVYDGLGDDTIYLSGESDTIYGGAGHNVIDGDTYLEEDDTTQVDYSDAEDRDKISYSEVKSFSLAELEFLKTNGKISNEDYQKLSGSYEELDDDGNPITNSLDIDMLKYYKGVYVDLEGFTDENTLWVDSDDDGVVDDDEKINALSKFALIDENTFTYDADGEVIATTITDTGLTNLQLVGQDKFTNIEDVDGSAYNDTIYGNDSKNIIKGLAGSDTLDGRGGGDELYGGSGYDILFSGSGDDYLDGGEDTDTVNYKNATNGVIVRLDKPDGDEHDDYATGYGTDKLKNIEDVSGSNFADTIYGSNSTNYIMGMDGDDKIISGRGYDFIDGGVGSDWISYYIDDYDDRGTNPNYMEDIQGITVTMGNDFVMLKETSTDRLIDLIKDIEQVSGTKGSDYIWGDSSDEIFWGHEGNDNLRGNNGADILYGGTGDDFLLPGAHQDHTDGGEGVDFLHLYYDRLKNKTEQWLRLDESGTVQYSTNSGGSWTDGYDTTSGGVNTAVNVEGIYASSGADHIIGNSKDNRFEGHNGDDEIYGEGGDDFIRGGNGADTLDGGDGEDIIYGDANNDIIDAGAGDDIIYGHSVHNKNYTNNDTIDGGAGNNTLNYNSSAYAFVLDMTNLDGSGYATVDFSASLPTTHSQNNTGNDHAFDDKIKDIQNIHGSRGGDTITGDASANIINGWWGHDTIYGGDENDILYGGVHVDKLYGEAGDDYINLDQYSDTNTRVHSQSGEYAYGGDGNDTIVSQGGSDYLYGEAGNDTFIVNYRPYELHGGDGRDVLTLGDTYLYLRGKDIQGLEELNIGSGSTYFNRDQFFNDNAFDKITGDENSQLFIYGSNGVNDSFDLSVIDLSGFSGMFNFYAYSGTDTLKIGTNQDINMNEYYYNTFEEIEIGANSNLNIEAYNDNGRTYLLDKDFSNVDESSNINVIGGAGNDTFRANYEALLAGKLTIDGGVGSDMVDVRTATTSSTLTFDEADMFSNIETLRLTNSNTRSNDIKIDAEAMKEWISSDSLILDLYNDAQESKITVSNAKEISGFNDSGVDFTGFDRGQTYDITLDDNSVFQMQVV
jgi:Ca2+-binding RTX toxin-like protein